MRSDEVRIYPELREEFDAEKIARALLSLIEKLTPEQRAEYEKDGEVVMKQLRMTVPGKGSAA